MWSLFKYNLILLFFGFIGKLSYAHQPEISSTVILEKDNQEWIVQVSGSLTAFKQEVNANYVDSYKTPEEFKDQVLAHVNKHLIIQLGKENIIKLQDGAVFLGHETKVIFKITSAPNTINNVSVKNTVFKDILNAQNFLYIASKGKEKKQFVLDKNNNYKVSLQTDVNGFYEVKNVTNASFMASFSSMIFVIIGLSIIALTIFYLKKETPNLF